MDDGSAIPPVTRRENPYKNPQQGREYKRKNEEEEKEEKEEEPKGPPTDDSSLLDVRV
ncbi:hypothetical protein ACFLQJ_00650 [Calditrichota bacterium]